MKKFKKKVRRDASNIDLAFLKWILPRLECFLQYNVGYPAEFGSRKNFDDEIREKIKWVRKLADEKNTLSLEEYDALAEKFGTWFGKYYRSLWI